MQLRGVRPARFARDLYREIRDDNLSNGAAALAFHLMLSVFPAAIFLLTLLPYLPIPNLEQAIMDLLREVLPGQAATMFEGTVRAVTTVRHSGLLSIGVLLTVWSASNGMYALMQQLNVTYDVKETRPFWKARATALGLTLMFYLLIVTALGLVVFGGMVQAWLGDRMGWSHVLLLTFAGLRWVIIGLFLLLGFALTYYLGPNAKQRFRFISPGAVFAIAGLVLTSVGLRVYVAHFARLDATYGSIGAVILFLVWLFVVGWVVLLGAEINALLESYAGERNEPPGARAEGEAQSGRPSHALHAQPT